MLISPYAKQDVSDMSGWRDLVESHVIDEEINERLGAGAVAAALLSEESSPEAMTAGINRMKELVSKQEPGADAGDIAQQLVNGRLGEASDELSPSRIKEAIVDTGGEDLAALVTGDNRDLV